MTYEEFYGNEYQQLKHIEQILLDMIHEYPMYSCPDGVEPILYCKTRIKKPDSMISKLEKHGLSVDGKTAINEMHDAVGMRIICSFLDDIYRIADWISNRQELTVLETKDYIAYPKDNGYRSLHLILCFNSGAEQGLKAEIQLRTIGIDFWAALEHQIKYKKDVSHEKIISGELKRCADEIASVDLSMQTLRDLILNNKWDE